MTNGYCGIRRHQRQANGEEVQLSAPWRQRHATTWSSRDVCSWLLSEDNMLSTHFDFILPFEDRRTYADLLRSFQKNRVDGAMLGRLDEASARAVNAMAAACEHVLPAVNNRRHWQTSTSSCEKTSWNKWCPG